MKWERKDPKRWKNKFAWWPTRVGGIYIWLEPYKERFIKGRDLGIGYAYDFERIHGDSSYIFTRYDA